MCQSNPVEFYCSFGQARPLLPRQSGMVTMAVAIIALFVTTLIVFAIGRAAVFEQKLVGNDLRQKEVSSAANAGMDFAINYLKTNWVGLSDAGTNTGWMAGLLANTTSTADSYAHEIYYERKTASGVDPIILEVRARATGVGDSQVTKTVTTYVIRSSLATGGLVAGPPLIVEECVGSITGSSDIWPLPTGEAVATMGLGGYSTGACDVETGHFDMHGGGVAEVSGSSSESAIEAFFGVSDPEQLRQFGELAPESFIYVDADYATDGYYTGYTGTGGSWHDNVGSQTAPVILFFSAESECPTINGNTEVYGIVFYDTSNCETPGGGGGEIWGSVIFTGSLEKFTANTNLDHLDLTSTLGSAENPIAKVTQIPGTWKDF